MNENLLKKLANIAIVRQHINYIVNSNTFDKKNVNPIQKIGRDLDAKFAELLISQPDESINVNVNFDSKQELVNVVESLKNNEPDVVASPSASPSATRPKIKISKKAT